MLKKVGEFLHISKAGNIIVKANPSNLPKVGSEVVDRKMRKVGFIYDIIGPVNQPYLVVKSYEDVEFKNLELFVVLEYGRNGKGKGERGRKGGRKKGNRKRRND